MDIALIVLKVTLVFLAAFGLALVCRRSPRHVHQMWSAAFLTVLALPLLATTLPPVSVPFWHRFEPAQAVESGVPSPIVVGAALGNAGGRDGRVVAPTALDPTATTTVAWPHGRAIWLSLWLAGAAPAVAMILLSLLRVHRLSASATTLGDPDWHATAAAIGRRLGLSRAVRLVVSDRIDIPMAGELWRPTVFLPAAAAGWDAGCRHAVLAHELTHLARHDPWRQLGARLMVAVYWFHPLAWIAARADAVACENACDEAVIRQIGLRPSEYARVLLELASPGSPRVAVAALPIVRRPDLERRLVTILNSPTGPMKARIMPMPALGCGVLAVLVASATPGAGAAMTSAGELLPRPDAVSPIASACGAAPNTGMVITELVSTTGFTRAMQRDFGALRVCVRAEGVPGPTTEPSTMLGVAARAVLEAQHLGTVQQLEIANTAPGRPDTTWRVDGIVRPLDADVDTWRRSMLSVLDTTWQLASLHGQRQTLEARMAAVAGEARNNSRFAVLRAEMRALDYDRRVAELDHRRQSDLTQFLRAVDAMRRVGSVPRTAVVQSSTESACDLAAPRLLAGTADREKARPRFLRESFDDLEICARIDAGNVFETVRPRDLMRRAGYAVLEARRGGNVHRLGIARDALGVVRELWQVNGVSRPVSAATETWRSHLVDVIDTSWDIWALQGQEGLLRGRQAEIDGQLANDEIRPGDADTRSQAIRAELTALDVDNRIARWADRRLQEVARFRAAMAAIQ